MMRRAILVGAVVMISSGCSFNAKLGGGAKNPGSSSSGGTSSGASELITVPELTWLSEADARKALANAGHRGTVSVDTSLCGSTLDGKVVALGIVCYQHPPAGREQGARLPIQIKVQTEDPYHGRIGQHGEWHLMPDVVGKTVADARVALRKAGFTLEERIKISEVNQPACAVGRVCRTYPEALNRLGLKSDMVLYVSAAPTAARPADPPPATDPSKPEQPAKPDAEPSDFFD